MTVGYRKILQCLLGALEFVGYRRRLPLQFRGPLHVISSVSLCMCSLFFLWLKKLGSCLNDHESLSVARSHVDKPIHKTPTWKLPTVEHSTLTRDTVKSDILHNELHGNSPHPNSTSAIHFTESHRATSRRSQTPCNPSRKSWSCTMPLQLPCGPHPAWSTASTRQKSKQ